MEPPEINKQLCEIIDEFGQSGNPRHKQFQQAKENQRKTKVFISDLEDSLDYLRVCVKYQIFDLEATQRENEYLIELIKENNH
jgi:hypothetical protein